ncbi:MAG: hypothetical protein ABI593_13930 [Betaproteobacteria bacterium]
MEAIARHGVPEIVNIGQVSQFTAAAFVDVQYRYDVRIKLDGKRCWRENVVKVRRWNPVKYAHVYRQARETTPAAGARLAANRDFDNRRRVHTSHD